MFFFKNTRCTEVGGCVGLLLQSPQNKFKILVSVFIRKLEQVYLNYTIVDTFLIFFEANLLCFIVTPVPLSAQMPFANAAKATQNGITAAIGASL